MWVIALVPIIVLCGVAPAVAQEWTPFVSIDDGFNAYFPGTPKVEQITWRTEYRQDLPGRVYTGEDPMGRYSSTVVDYRGLEKLHNDWVSRCGAAKGANGLDGDSCQNDFTRDAAGAVEYAVWTLMNREGVRTTHYMWAQYEFVASRQIHLTNPDSSRTLAIIFMHDGRLYIHQATAPKGMPEPLLFMQNVGIVDEKGLNIRYKTFYTQGYGEWKFLSPPPPRNVQQREY
jgi:hypothetical protein